MALQSSGQIKMSELNIEFGHNETRMLLLKDASDGTAGTINTANASTDRPDGTAPHAISEFYSYDHSATSVTASDYYWLGDGVNDTIRFSGHSSTLFQLNDDFSYSGWYRIDETINDTQFLATFGESTPSGSNLIFIMYHKTSARMMLRFRKGGGGNFHQRFWSLYSTNNASISGITSAGWKSNTRGNANSEGFVHLVFTRDNSNTASSGMNCYWNGQKLPDHIQFNSRSLANFNIQSAAIGDAISASPNNALVFKGGIDAVSVYNKTLTQAEVTALYNSGVPTTCSDASVTSNLMAEYRLENNTTNTSGTFPSLTNTGGTFTTY
jgi:hypothetical protein|tara:strand:+ start:362 stop:1336 length:975 start_codon:yes stop_codon:yes gene_type:complete